VKEEESKGVFGVKITLRSTLSSEQSRTIATTTTDENGIYTFFNVFPDTYMILAEHPSWSFAKVFHL
jgi:protocatechuate 3,4-dioxygenase beta subunit